METLKERILNMLHDERGATAIEYALIASLLGIALLPALGSTTSGVASLYTKVNGYFTAISP